MVRNFLRKRKKEKRINTERTEEALQTGATVIAAACPFCNTMLTDGVKGADKEQEVAVLDIAEIIEKEMLSE